VLAPASSTHISIDQDQKCMRLELLTVATVELKKGNKDSLFTKVFAKGGGGRQ